MRLVTDSEEFLKLEREYRRSDIFYDDLVAVEMAKSEVVLCKPIYTGFSICELAKLLVYDFHYDKMLGLKENFSVEFLFTDTDSLCYYMVGNGLYEALSDHSDLFDFSDYPKNHPLYSERNKKVHNRKNER